MPVTTADLPRSIRVGPYDIEITIATADELPHDYGQFCAADQEIKLQAEFKTAPLAVDTLLHELLHAAWFAGALPKQYEERVISSLAPCLTQVFRDHPALLQWLGSTLR